MSATVVMGIDAAWTAKNPSGVAVVVRSATGWKLVALASSYTQFAELTVGRFVCVGPSKGSPLNASQLLERAEALAGSAVGMVAVDMPLAKSAIVGRRFSDNEVSRAYGGHGAGTHSPSASRPGPIGFALTEQFGLRGYSLCTQQVITPGVVEVYPHPALIELAGTQKRLPYKAQNVGKYWADLPPQQRRLRLFKEWSMIIELLDGEIAGVAEALPPLTEDAVGAVLKAHEDALDAVICAWVGVCALEGRAVPFGNEDSSIWIPRRMR